MWDPRVPRGTAAVRDLIVTSELSAQKPFVAPRWLHRMFSTLGERSGSVTKS